MGVPFFYIMLNLYLSLIKFSHTIFALPFALIGFYLAFIKYQPIDFSLKFIYVLLAMIFARSAAMAFNRYIDRNIDANNPRTKDREIPAGKISSKAALSFVIFNVIGFILVTFFINDLCFYLSPLALLVVLGYSYTKRFTWLCHYILGLGLALAPIGAYLSISGEFNFLSLILGVSVFFWVGGFDIIYALQDAIFDISFKLKSIPARFGVEKAILISRISHFLSANFLLMGIFNMDKYYPEVGILSWLAFSFFIILLIRQHFLVKIKDLTKINQAFFESNGLASILLGSLIIIDLFF
ncbi:MAG: 4-hydroxybenzoate polyprenyltransferase [Bacteroidota bacterium]